MSNRVRHLPHRRRQACLALASLALAGAARAEIATAVFQIDDTPGEIHLSDRADAAPGTAVRRVAGSTEDAAPRAPAPAAIADIIHAAAASQHLPPALIEAVIGAESAYRERAVSPRGASGLMQLMPATARLYGVTDIFDPRQNVAAGSRHLRGLLDRYGQDLARALAAYNAGTGAVDRAAVLHQGWPSAETAAYVPDVMRRFAALESAGSPRAAVASAR